MVRRNLRFAVLQIGAPLSRFLADPKYTKLEVREYLSKLYNVNVARVATCISYGGKEVLKFLVVVATQTRLILCMQERSGEHQANATFYTSLRRIRRSMYVWLTIRRALPRLQITSHNSMPVEGRQSCTCESGIASGRALLSGQPPETIRTCRCVCGRVKNMCVVVFE